MDGALWLGLELSLIQRCEWVTLDCALVGRTSSSVIPLIHCASLFTCTFVNVPAMMAGPSDTWGLAPIAHDGAWSRRLAAGFGCALLNRVLWAVDKRAIVSWHAVHSRRLACAISSAWWRRWGWAWRRRRTRRRGARRRGAWRRRNTMTANCVRDQVHQRIVLGVLTRIKGKGPTEPHAHAIFRDRFDRFRFIVRYPGACLGVASVIAGRREEGN